MPRELMKDKKERALKIAERMNEHYPAAECALHYWGDPFKLTIAVLLSAQTTDKGVNKVTPALWERYPTPEALAQAEIADVENIIRTIGFYHAKAANCINAAHSGNGIRRRNPPRYATHAEAARSGPQNRQRSAERSIRHC
ncbi:MAG: hypothetical protein V8T51_01690 [Senegalimassilia faecalis]